MAVKFQSGYAVFDLEGAVATTGGAIGAFENPEGCDLIICDVKLIVDTPSTGGANISVGVAADATTSDTDLINALAINGSITGKAYHGMTALAAKGEAVVWGADEYITASGSASSADFEGRLFVKYIRTTEQ